MSKVKGKAKGKPKSKASTKTTTKASTKASTKRTKAPPKFQIYDELVEDLKETPAKKMDPRKLCSIINSVNLEHREILYILILHHSKLKSTNSKTWNMNPYKGKTFEGGKGVKYNWVHLPSDLQDIIIKYIEKISETE